MASESHPFQCVEVVLLKDLQRGDHISVKGELANLSPMLCAAALVVGEKYYFHHGIFIGNGEVIDFGGQNKSVAKPRKVDLLRFMEGSCDRKLYRVRYEPGTCLSVDETIKMAEDMVANTSNWPMYHLIRNNCETFATYLKTKVKSSSQCMKALFKAILVGTAAMAGSSVAAVSSPVAGSLVLGASVVTPIRASEPDKSKDD